MTPNIASARETSPPPSTQTWLQCSSCNHEWREVALQASKACPLCNAESVERRPSGVWGWAEATQAELARTG